jgi:hypothetical protein
MLLQDTYDIESDSDEEEDIQKNKEVYPLVQDIQAVNFTFPFILLSSNKITRVSLLY